MKLALRSWMVIFPSLLAVRLFSAFYTNISDCDETYNYWEPLHYLLHGTGLQTWEYSPAYGIRSYAYIALHALPLIPLTAFSKTVQFYSLRVILSTVCAACESYFIRAVTKATGVPVGLTLWLTMLTGCGMYIASAAFLPSSFAMYCTMVAFGAWASRNTGLAVFATALGALVGWPFSAVLGVPIALEVVVVQRRLLAFLGWSLASLALILGPVVAVDYYYYGQFLCAPLNIVLYNVFGGGGPELYGTEPWWYYLLNGALNFNVLLPFALAALPLALVKLVTGGASTWIKREHKYSCGMLLALTLWLMIFMTRPHKEERFLFPVYPLLYFAVAYGMQGLEELLGYLSGRRYRKADEVYVAAAMATMFIHGLLSVSRVLALYHGYHAPLEVYPQLKAVQQDLLPEHPSPLNVCVGKEWYRYPTSFMLPSHHWKLRFVRSEFRAQLPKPFEAPPPEGTRVIPTHFNDMNKEEQSRYFNISQCHFLVDLDVPRASRWEPRYSVDTQHWEVVVRQPFLDALRSHKFFRAFFIPWVSPKMCHMVDYVVLLNKRLPSVQT